MVRGRRRVGFTADQGEVATDEDEADELEDEAEVDEEPEPPTSIEDLTSEADPETFDRTFTAGDANLTIQGRFDPVAGTKQVLPRVAYTINFNMVWNPDRGRWEPDEGNEGGGLGSPVASGAISVSAGGAESALLGVTDPDAKLLRAVAPATDEGTQDVLQVHNTINVQDSTAAVAFLAWREPFDEWQIQIKYDGTVSPRSFEYEVYRLDT